MATFNTTADAVAAGYRNPEKKYGDVDISGPNSFGYAFRSLDGQVTETIWFDVTPDRMGGHPSFGVLFAPIGSEPIEQRQARLARLLDANYQLKRNSFPFPAEFENDAGWDAAWREHERRETEIMASITQIAGNRVFGNCARCGVSMHADGTLPSDGLCDRCHASVAEITSARLTGRCIRCTNEPEDDDPSPGWNVNEDGLCLRCVEDDKAEADQPIETELF